MTNTSQTTTQVGNYFVSNYPPFSQWKPDFVGEAIEALDQPARTDEPFGLYLHIPFCRKRCKFCYFKVYTDKNANEIEVYLNALIKEAECYARTRAFQGRELRFAYFGGGTPSYISERQLEHLVEGLNRHVTWNNAEEVTFECEPGTLTEAKLAAIRGIGVTRLSLGVENFDDQILEANGRAHRSPEIGRAYAFARSLDFPQINIDLIAGMLGETDENWRRCIDRTLELSPDSVTIYQMELPFNTTISGNLLKGTGRFAQPADWPTKRRWVREAFEALEAAGYHVRSAYTAVKNPERTRFVYTDRLWQGADMVGLGVASFGHINGVHVQNLDTWETYSAAIRRGEVPLSRAYRPTDEERFIREFILQLKLGSIAPTYFRDKYRVDVLERFRDQLESLKAEGYLQTVTDTAVALTRDGLLRVDGLLTRFFLPQHAGIRYT